MQRESWEDSLCSLGLRVQQPRKLSTGKAFSLWRWLPEPHICHPYVSGLWEDVLDSPPAKPTVHPLASSHSLPASAVALGVQHRSAHTVSRCTGEAWVLEVSADLHEHRVLSHRGRVGTEMSPGAEVEAEEGGRPGISPSGNISYKWFPHMN